MFENFEQLRLTFENSKPSLSNYLGSKEIDSFAIQLKERSQNHQPIVMVYGVYNAGKSTLLNALLGREEAEVGDIPQTDKVSSYQIGDVKIYDTPGIDAPIEHEKITRIHLEKSDAVVFVLSSDGVLEEQNTYHEIEQILISKKPIILVINNKSGYEPSSDEYTLLIQKFQSNLNKHLSGKDQLIEQVNKYPPILINAKLALKGKLTNKDKLIEHSQIRILEKLLTRLFKETNSAQVAKTLSMQLNNLISNALSIAEKDSKNDDLNSLQTLMTEFSKEKNSVKENIESYANKTKPLLKSDLLRLAQDGANSEISQRITVWTKENTDQFEYQCQRSLKRLDEEASEVAKLFIVNSSIDIKDNNTDESNENGFGIQTLFDNLSKFNFGKAIPEELVKDGVVTVLKQGKSWLPNVFKGIGPKTMEKMAGKVVPFVGPVIDTVMAIFNYVKAAQYQQQQIDNENRRIDNINAQMNLLVENVYESFLDAVEDSLDDTFDPMIKGLESNLKRLSKEIGSNESTIAQLKLTQETLIQLTNN